MRFNPLQGKPWRLWLNGLLFHVVWLLCVTSSELLAVMGMVVFVILHHRTAISSNNEWVFVAVLATLGILADSTIASLNLITYATSQPDSTVHFIGHIPLWLAILWVAFSMTLHHSFFALARYPLLSVACGLFLAPLSYYSGALLSGATINVPLWRFLAVEGLLWATLLPVALNVATDPRFQRQARGNEIIPNQ